MTLKDFLLKVKDVILKAYHWVYDKVNILLDLLKNQDKKFSTKRIFALILVIDGIWILCQSRTWLGAAISGAQVIGGAVLMIVAVLTKT